MKFVFPPIVIGKAPFCSLGRLNPLIKHNSSLDKKKFKNNSCNHLWVNKNKCVTLRYFA